MWLGLEDSGRVEHMKNPTFSENEFLALVSFLDRDS